MHHVDYLISNIYVQEKGNDYMVIWYTLNCSDRCRRTLVERLAARDGNGAVWTGIWPDTTSDLRLPSRQGSRVRRRNAAIRALAADRLAAAWRQLAIGSLRNRLGYQGTHDQKSQRRTIKRKNRWLHAWVTCVCVAGLPTSRLLVVMSCMAHYHGLPA